MEFAVTSGRSSSRSFLTRTFAAGATLACLVASPAPPTRAADPPGWRLVWSDDFDKFDESLWTRESSDRPTNNSLHAYLPEQVSVEDGKLILTSEDKPSGKLAYRSGLVKSKRAQRLGRWEVRAKLPTGAGLWPAIWLLPDGPWPSEGEIDFMESRGDRPALVTSAFHWGTQSPYFHDFHVVEHRASRFGKPVTYHDDFHTFAVEWLPDQIRFYVDDLQHAVFYSDECGDFFPKLTAPMRLILNTAIGGEYASPPDATTKWPQRFEVDWVRVYEATEAPGEFEFVNGDFEAQDGSLAGWHVFGNDLKDNPNVSVHREAVRGGKAALKLFGPFAGGETYSGVSQGIAVAGGDRVAARLFAQVRASDSFSESGNQVFAKIEFYKNRGDYFGGPAMLGVEEQLIADASTTPDEWHEHELAATAPAGSVEARLSIVFRQRNNAPGAVFVDDVEFARAAKK